MSSMSAIRFVCLKKLDSMMERQRIMIEGYSEIARGKHSNSHELSPESVTLIPHHEMTDERHVIKPTRAVCRRFVCA